MIPQAVVIVTATLTLRSDDKPIRITVNKPRGTVYWGGAGLDGIYLQDQVDALQQAGIRHVWVGRRTMGALPDAARSASDLRYKGRSDDQSWMIEGMEKVSAPQFNLIGYSYGSLMAAQTAHVYGSNGHVVDHLVLIGSPIDADFLADLQGNPNIKRVIIINLQEHGDPIYAGISQWRLTAASWKLKTQDEESGNTMGVGHFYYRPASDEGKRRRRELAKLLVQQGVQ